MNYIEVTPEHPEYLECVGAFEGTEASKYFIHTLYPANHYGPLQFCLQTNGKYLCFVSNLYCETESLPELLAFMAEYDMNKP